MAWMYPHTATITRRTALSPSLDSDGLPTGATTSETELYAGACDFQDGLSRSDRDQLGDRAQQVDGRLFLPEAVTAFEEGDRVSITGVAPGALEGTVEGVRYLDDKLYVRID